MKLEDWLKKNDRSNAWFAKQIKVTPNTIGNLIRGTDTSLSIALRIEDTTKGEVKCRDLLKTKKPNKSH
jgi:plasmid maintenance system antidote protein VapI